MNSYIRICIMCRARLQADHVGTIGGLQEDCQDITWDTQRYIVYYYKGNGLVIQGLGFGALLHKEARSLTSSEQF